MSYANAQLAIESALATPLSSFGTLIKWPGGPNINPQGAAHAIVRHMKGRTSVDTLGASGSDLIPGITQIDAYYPLQSGNLAGTALVDTLRGTFKAGQWVTKSGQAVLIRACGPGPEYEEGTYFKSIAMIEWEVRIAR